MANPVLAALPAVGKIFGGLSGLFGKKEKAPSPRDNIMSQAQGARDAAEEYGFNPLTMLQFGQPSGSIAGGQGPAPLASIEMLTSGLSGLDDVFSGDAARRRQADQLEIDMAQIKLDRARAGILEYNQTAAESVFRSQPSYGGRPAVFHQPNAEMKPARITKTSYRPEPAPRDLVSTDTQSGQDEVTQSVAPGYDVEKSDIKVDPGFLKVHNEAVGTLYVPAIDGEPLDAGQLIGVGPAVLPQLVSPSNAPYVGRSINKYFPVQSQMVQALIPSLRHSAPARIRENLRRRALSRSRTDDFMEDHIRRNVPKM